MKTALKLGPADDGRPLTRDEFHFSTTKEGYVYELAGGRLRVSAFPSFNRSALAQDVRDAFRHLGGRGSVAETYSKAWVYGPEEEAPTILYPDLAVYCDIPKPVKHRAKLNWWDLQPYIVADVIDQGDPFTFLRDNPGLYSSILSVHEYWVLDTRRDLVEPDLIVHQRHGRGWRLLIVPYGETYTTPLLPGFSLNLSFTEE